MIKKALSRLFGRKYEPAVRPDIAIIQLPEWTVIDGSQPEGNWVQWKIGGGSFQVDPIIPSQKYHQLALRLTDQAKPSVRIVRQEHRLGVVIELGPDDPDELVGYAPNEFADYERGLPEAMPRAAQLKGVLSDGTDVRIVVAGLMPTAKVRREKGWEKAPPRSIVLSSSDIAAFEILLTRLRAVIPISETEAERRRKSNLDAMLSKIEKGQPVESDNYGLGHFSLPEMEMRDYMKQADNSLSEQCKIISNMLDVWFDRGISPAPYYPRRVGIILRKAKRKDLNKVFCSEWDRHFP